MLDMPCVKLDVITYHSLINYSGTRAADSCSHDHRHSGSAQYSERLETQIWFTSSQRDSLGERSTLSSNKTPTKQVGKGVRACDSSQRVPLTCLRYTADTVLRTVLRI